MTAINTTTLSPEGASGRIQFFNFLIVMNKPFGNPPADFGIVELYLDCTARTIKINRLTTYVRPATFLDRSDPNLGSQPLPQDMAKLADMACGGRSRWVGDSDVDAVRLMARYRAGLQQGGQSSAGSATASRPSDAQLAVRDLIPDTPGSAPRCRFRAVPGLVLSEPSARGVDPSADYRIDARQVPASSESSFSVLLQNRPDQTNWEGLHSQSGFFFEDPRHARSQVVRARLLLDGRDSGLPLVVRHEKESGASWANSLGVSINEDRQDRLVTAVARARTAVVELYASGASPAFTWTFDVAPLREVPRALRLSHWRCS
jgi:hypothetical protein